MAGIGVPIKLLHEAAGLTVTVELKTGQVYRGKLTEIEDNMNVTLKEATVTGRDGQVRPLEGGCFLRGSTIRYFIVPDNLRHAPFLVKMGSSSSGGGAKGIQRSAPSTASLPSSGRPRGPRKPPVRR